MFAGQLAKLFKIANKDFDTALNTPLISALKFYLMLSQTAKPRSQGTIFLRLFKIFVITQLCIVRCPLLDINRYSGHWFSILPLSEKPVYRHIYFYLLQ